MGCPSAARQRKWKIFVERSSLSAFLRLKLAFSRVPTVSASLIRVIFNRARIFLLHPFILSTKGTIPSERNHESDTRGDENFRLQLSQNQKIHFPMLYHVDPVFDFSVVKTRIRIPGSCVRRLDRSFVSTIPTSRNDEETSLPSDSKRGSFFPIIPKSSSLLPRYFGERIESPPWAPIENQRERRSLCVSFSFPPSCFLVLIRDGGVGLPRLGFIPKAVCTLAGE